MVVLSFICLAIEVPPVVFGVSLLKAVEIHSQLSFSVMLNLLQHTRILLFARGILTRLRLLGQVGCYFQACGMLVDLPPKNEGQGIDRPRS